MENGLNLRVVELLCSRLCHDLISPVAALSNGLELLADDDGSGAQEISGLLTLSAGQAAGRLMFFRTAYGLGGDHADALTIADVGSLVRGILDGDKTTLDWPDRTDRSLGRFGTKLLLNAAAIALESLPRGGRVALAIDGDNPVTLVLDASGAGAALRPETEEGISESASIAVLSPRSVHGYFTAWMARAHGGRLDVASRPDGVSLRLRIPSAG
jgi:histidine phosphotransferase ChpT